MLNLVYFSSNSLDLQYIQQISPQFIVLLVFQHVANFRFLTLITAEI